METLSQLTSDFRKLEKQADPIKRGYLFEKWLYRLFLSSGLVPRMGYKIPHEQIDISFEYKNRYFLVEAKWRSELVRANDIRDFSVKAQTKLANTIGILISISGFSKDINDLCMLLPEKNVILFDKLDIECVLDKKLSLPLIIEEKLKAASFGSNFYYKSQELIEKLTQSNVIDHVAIARELLQNQIQKVHKKYDEDLYVKRQVREKIIKEISSRPISSKQNVFVLVDRAGSGKTNILCDLSKFLSKNSVVIFLLGNIQVGVKDSLLDHINRYLRVLFERNAINFSPSAFWDTLRFRARNERLRCYVIIDGINENPNIEAFISELEFFAASFIDDEWLTILLSCRDVYWEYFERRSTFMSYVNDPIKNELYEFGEDEFKTALNKYIKRFNISVKLVGDAYSKCKHPLLLRFFCEAYKNKTLSVLTNIRLVELFELYWKRKLESIEEKTPMQRKVKYEVNAFLYCIAGYMYSINNRYIPYSVIGPITRGIYYGQNMADIYSLYSRILDEDIILEEVSPSEGIQFGKDYEDEQYCTFVYEEFMEYIIACSLEMEMRKSSDSELMGEVEKLFAKQKQFINVIGVMLYLAYILKQKRGLSIWSKLYEKGGVWQGVLIDAIVKCPEELIDYEFIDLLKQISESICKQFSFGYKEDTSDYDSNIELAPSKIIELLGHRKFRKFKDEIAEILELFLSIEDKSIRRKGALELAALETKRSILSLLENFKEITQFDADLKTIIIRLLIKTAKKATTLNLILENLPMIWDGDVSNFFKEHSSFIRHNLYLSKKEFDLLLKKLN